MRPIEFRARREFDDRGHITQNGEWVYGSLVFYGDDSAYSYKIIPTPNIDESDYVWIDHKTVGQFTGLKDKNGKKIWEGDVVQTNSGPREVTFRDGCFGVMADCRIVADGIDELDEQFYTLDIENDAFLKVKGKTLEMVCVMEVLGNIYEHEHLLTK